MTKKELSNLKKNQRIVWQLNDNHGKNLFYGYVVKKYNGNYQIKVHFHKNSVEIIGYKQIELVKV